VTILGWYLNESDKAKLPMATVQQWLSLLPGRANESVATPRPASAVEERFRGWWTKEKEKQKKRREKKANSGWK
jgi:DICT domain-containing protein